jgi:hypothetical protein
MKIKKFIDALNQQFTDDVKMIEPLEQAKLKLYYQKAKTASKEGPIEEVMYQLWRKNATRVTDYQALLVHRQINHYVSQHGQEHYIDIWYFKNDERPFYIHLFKGLENRNIIPDVIEEIIDHYPCDYVAYKAKLSASKAAIIYNQIIYYCLTRHIELMNPITFK